MSNDRTCSVEGISAAKLESVDVRNQIKATEVGLNQRRLALIPIRINSAPRIFDELSNSFNSIFLFAGKLV